MDRDSPVGMANESEFKLKENCELIFVRFPNSAGVVVCWVCWVVSRSIEFAAVCMHTGGSARAPLPFNSPVGIGPVNELHSSHISVKSDIRPISVGIVPVVTAEGALHVGGAGGTGGMHAWRPMTGLYGCVRGRVYIKCAAALLCGVWRVVACDGDNDTQVAQLTRVPESGCQKDLRVICQCCRELVHAQRGR